jgi:hypothetical protein
VIYVCEKSAILVVRGGGDGGLTYTRPLHLHLKQIGSFIESTVYESISLSIKDTQYQL